MVRKARIPGFKSDLVDFLDGFFLKRSRVMCEANEGNIASWWPCHRVVTMVQDLITDMKGNLPK